ncbi:MAG TPA: SGNH/GDSL hydrolase family protein [Roseiarcus sp.]|nr:SGNH/GDSL hydrolase family protein [Roseiarcus sp.]
MRSFKGLRWVALFVGIFLSVEGVSSIFIFRYYAHKKLFLSPEGTATGFVIKKALGVHPIETFEADKPEMFRPDSILGYTTNPGVYNITQTIGATKHGYRVTVTESGVRATSYHSTSAAHRIYVLGNSLIWAIGLDDEMTAPWLLQTRLPDYQVINLALTGYSNVQQLLQYQKLKDNLQPDDVVVLSYSAIDLLNNVADPVSTKGLSDGYEMSLSSKESFRDAQIPYANLSKDGELVISYTPMVCSSEGMNRCIRNKIEPKVREVIADKIFAEVMQDRKSHVIVAFLDGSDDDPVISFLRSSGAPIADLRIKPGMDYDDYLPGEAGRHRGAFASFRFYEALFAALSKNQMLMSRDYTSN